MKHRLHIRHFANIPTANILVKGSCAIKCFVCITYMRHIPTFNQDIGSWDISSLKNATGMFNASAMTLNNMDSTLRGWAKH
jgi:hypothetical protein